MISFDIRAHPPSLFAYQPNQVELMIKAENKGDESRWCEAGISVPEKLSLSPDSALRKARVRVGIAEKNTALEKSLRIYANGYTNPQMYRCKVTLYTYDRSGVIDSRLEKSVDIRCELKKPEVL